jgi:UDP-N-acetylglucosamine 3-dehydrogenase
MSQPFTMSDYRIGFVGTGAPPDSPGSTGFAMAYRHANAYQARDDCELTACADIDRENANLFAETYDLPTENVYEDYREMLAATDLDVVSVCVNPSLHAELVLGCIESGAVDAVHCEKPMADTWCDCREMVLAANDAGVQLTFNHQRRFGGPFRKAKSLLDEGAVDALERVEFAAGNVFDYGAHSFDLSNFFADEADPEWVIGQVDYRTENVHFGAHNENQALVQWRYENGIDGLAATGHGDQTELVGCHNRLVGTDGIIEVGVGFCCSHSGPTLRVKRGTDADWETITTKEDIHGHKDATGLNKEQAFLQPAIDDIIEGLEYDRTPELCGDNGLRATQLIFGAWESARRRGRIDFPLTIDDNPLAAMVESGDLTPVPRED